ncbi:sodium-coupled monocarboxylate transporter 1-like isoform X1 [Toxorhynchites rutilus septentrionalis]|uniref:sodium-coupled monocarboxylate transporter 1-like isoform X1 n=2 Tax=Toxorhynchites rutilus septentrionalis TaxID=329112 RepID=UPI00247AEF9C|nr:sodium-coupled monocarboxylate transporter 1-like isoform X1 [Toxorhynchites rutilus septentrionalis]
MRLGGRVILFRAIDTQFKMQTRAPSGLTVQDVGKSLQRFGTVDYIIFSAMLLACVIIGAYFGWQDHEKRRRRKTQSRRGSEALDYLVGGRRMQTLPVAMSLVASWVSGIALMGAATETYLYGIHFAYIFTGIIAMAVSMNFIFLPIFHGLQITSVYEYLEMRFDKRVRLLGSILFTFATLLHLPIVVYVPALAFNQVSGISVHSTTIVVCIVCIFYTGVGGIKAVVWTDVLQTVVMVASLVIIVVKGTADIGGLAVLIERNIASGRIEPPNFSIDPTERTSIWAIFIGGGFFWIAKNAIHQMMVQRYLSLPNFRDAQQALLIFTICIICLMSICFYNGLLIYATFHDCDPLTTKLAQAKDQLLPILVMKVFGEYPGLAGLFISGIFSASLSSLSTGLNSLAAIILEDFFKPFFRQLTETQTRYLMRGTVLFFGIVAVVLVMVVEKLGTVLQLSMSLVPISLGPLLGVFLMGMLLPRINGRCALSGAVTGLLAMLYIVIRAQISIAFKEFVHTTKPVSVAGCTYEFDNVTIAISAEHFPEVDKSIHRISFLYYTVIGATVTSLSGFLYSFYLGTNDLSTMDPSLIAPFLREYIFPKEILSRTPVVHSFDLNTNPDTKL